MSVEKSNIEILDMFIKTYNVDLNNLVTYLNTHNFIKKQNTSIDDSSDAYIEKYKCSNGCNLEVEFYLANNFYTDFIIKYMFEFLIINNKKVKIHQELRFVSSLEKEEFNLYETYDCLKYFRDNMCKTRIMRNACE